MIDKLNNIILKLILFKQIHINLNRKIKIHEISNIKNNQQNLNIKYILYNFIFKFFFFTPKTIKNVNNHKNNLLVSHYLFCNIFIKFYKKKNIKFNFYYLSNILKQKKLINNSLYNFHFKKNLFFYKNFNKIYLENHSESNYLGNNYNPNKFISVKKFKKKDEIINPKYFLTYKIKNKFFKKITKHVDKKLFKLLNLENLNFNAKTHFLNYTFKFKSQSKKFFLFFGVLENKMNFIKQTTYFNKKYFNRFFIRKYHYFQQSNDLRNVFFIETKKKIKKIFNFKLNFAYFFFSKKLKKMNVKLIFNVFMFKVIFHTQKNKINFETFLKSFNNYKENKYSHYIENVYKNIIFLNDFYNDNSFYKNQFSYFLSNKHFLKSFNVFGNSKIKIDDPYKLNSDFYYNNYYPIFYTKKKTTERFFSKFKINLNINYLAYMQFYILGFLENFFKKRIFIKTTNNFFQKPEHLKFLLLIFNDYKNYQPKYMKNFLIRDFLDIIWYSFYLRDLTLLTDWVSRFLENTNFRVHKKFLLFFNNFIHKYSNIFIDILRIKGFFFDIRGKVGVTGNSKKRHSFIKIGKLNKSTKVKKMNFSQSVARTPSGALGLTFLLNY